MRQLIWLIPLVPLAGFLINGLVYLLSHRTKNAPGHGHGHDPEEDGHGEAHAVPPVAGSHPPTGHGHGAHAVIPFKGLHTAVGVGTVGIACLLAFGAIFDVGLKAFAHGESVTRVLYRWIPLGVNQAVGEIPGPAREWVVDVASASTRSPR